MTRTSTHYLKDILTEINHIKSSCEQISFDEFVCNYEKQYAIIRALEIIGEAANKVEPRIQENHPEIPWYKIIGLRNVIVHEYFGLDLELIWEIIHTNLPELEEQIALLLDTQLN